MKQVQAGRRAVAAMLLGAALSLAWNGKAAAGRYPWRADASMGETLASRIAPPAGFARIPAPPGSFGEWLRGLPLKPAGTAVYLHDGRRKPNQQVHAAVIDIDIGSRDLQQCADAVMRLRAEYLLGAGRAKDIAFDFTDGKRHAYQGPAGDYKAFRRYMDRVFAYAGSWSLEREMRPVALADMHIGDVFIRGGFPGHAVLVVDMAANPATAEMRFLLVQSYMPAQDMHVLKNPRSADGTPWYALPTPGQELITPEWTFPAGTLRRFRDEA